MKKHKKPLDHIKDKKLKRQIAEAIVPDDLPDGAYFAMMDEMGMSIEDFEESEG